MKKILLAVFISLFSLTGYSNISDPDLFKLDEKSLDIEFAELNKLENYVVLNRGITLAELLIYNKNICAFLSGINTGSPSPMDLMFALDENSSSVCAGSLCCCLLGISMVSVL